ncbi:MAG: selenide, water dikinase SelD, partial [Gemmatimonadetes bacterium]|nr:selenide, water dikinase SelD [Gemmatimonadota bacterium]
MAVRTVRLTAYARGGGCACKIPPGQLDALVTGLGDVGPGFAPNG